MKFGSNRLNLSKECFHVSCINTPAAIDTSDDYLKTVQDFELSAFKIAQMMAGKFVDAISIYIL